MALNRLYDTMLALGPRYLLRNEPSTSGETNTLAKDSSGNGLDFVRTLGTGGDRSVAGPFHVSKNDAATNKVWLLGSGGKLVRTGTSGLANTSANLSTTGITVIAWGRWKNGNWQCVLDTTTAAGVNGIRVMPNVKMSGGIGTATDKMTVCIIDPAGNTSYRDFTEILNGSRWSDEKWHMIAVRLRSKVASGGFVSDEIIELLIDAVPLTPSATAANVATGTLTDPAGSQAHNWFAFSDGSANNGTDHVSICGWYNSLLSDEQILSIYHAATYTVGDADSGYASIGFSGAHTEGDADVNSAGSVPVNGEPVSAWYLQNDKSKYFAVNVDASDKADYLVDANGRKGPWLDGITQNYSGPQVGLEAAAGSVAAFPTRMSMMVCAVPTSGDLQGAGTLSLLTLRAAADNYGFTLGIKANRAVLIANTVAKETASSFPAVSTSPSPGVFGFSTGNGAYTTLTHYNNGFNAITTGVAWGGAYTGEFAGPVRIGKDVSAGGSSFSSSRFVAGFAFATFIASRPLHPLEAAALTRYWAKKYTIDRQDTLVEIWGDSISSGVPNDPNLLCTNHLWQTGLSAATQLRIQARNESIGGQMSGTLTRTDNGNPFANNGNDFDSRGYMPTGMWTANPPANLGVPGTHVAVFMIYTNDLAQADFVEGLTNAAMANQMIQNFLNWKAARRAYNPLMKILVVLPPASWATALSDQKIYNALVAWFEAHPEAYDAVLIPEGRFANGGDGVWVHPEFADYADLGRQIDAKLAPMLAAADASDDLGAARVCRMGR